MGVRLLAGCRVRSEFDQQVGEECPDVGDDGDVGRKAPADFGGVEVDLDVAGAERGGKIRRPVGLHALEATAEIEQHVRFVENPLRHRRAVGAKSTGGKRVVVSDNAPAGQARQHRRG